MIYNFENLTEVKKNTTGTGLLIENDGRIQGNDDLIKQVNEDMRTGKKFVIPEHFVVSAVFQKYGIKNANGRIYPENVLKKEVEKYMTRVRNHNALGALDHPASSTLSGHDVSHNILDLRWEGRTLVGEMELQLSPGYIRYGVCSTSGDLVANMILSGYLIGVSSRGVGSVEQSLGQYMVQDDFELIGWDVVLEPSTPNAWIGKSMRDLDQYKEDKDINGSPLNEKLAKINSILV